MSLLLNASVTADLSSYIHVPITMTTILHQRRISHLNITDCFTADWVVIKLQTTGRAG